MAIRYRSGGPRNLIATRTAVLVALVALMSLAGCLDEAPDDQATPLTGIVVPTAEPGSRAWEQWTDTGTTADRQVIGISLRSTTYGPSRGDDEAILNIRCQYGGNQEPSWEAYIFWDAPLVVSDNPFLEGDAAWVHQRFGDEEVERGYWGLSDSKTATFAELPDFLTKLQQSTRFAASVTAYEDVDLVATWDTTGLIAALIPLNSYCATDTQAKSVELDSEATGGWQLATDSDPLSDRRVMGLALRSTTYDPEQWGDYAVLYIACTYGGNRTSRWDVIIDWHTHLASKGPIEGLIRFGSGEVFSLRWELDEDGQSTVFPTADPDSPLDIFLAQLQASDRFVARVARYDDSIITATWHPTGLTAALQPLQGQCR